MKKNEERREHNPIDIVYSLFMKLFFYLGIFGFLPYFFLHISPSELPFSDFNALLFYTIFVIGALLILLIMDLIGMNTSYIDRISRLITVILTVIGGITTIFLFLITQNNWSDQFLNNIFLSTILMSIFSFLGWFFVRSDRGLSPRKSKTLLNETSVVLLLLGLIFMGDFFLNGFFLLCMAGLFLLYPFAIIKWGKPKVVPHIESRRLVHEYSRKTFYNYVIDAIKAILILLTIMALSYDGTVVLYPTNNTVSNHLWIRNLAFVGIWSAVALELYIKIQKRFYGLLVMILMFIFGISQYLLVNTFKVYFWWLITPINGFILAAIFFFIEQKIYESDNISVMPGSFYIILMIPLITGLLLRADPQIDDILENMKFTLSVLGIGYILGYVREAPKQKSLRASI